MNRMNLLATALCVVGLLSSMAGCERQASVASPATSGSLAIDRVTAGKPARKSLKLLTIQPGRVEAFEEAPLYPKVAGYVEEMLVDIGDAVEKDQRLVKLSAPEMLDEVKQMEALVARADAESKQAEAAVKSAEAATGMEEAKVAQSKAGIERAAGDYQRWQAEHARLAGLAKNGSVTQRLVDETRNQLQAADASRQEAAANVAACEAALKAAAANIEKSRADLVAAEAQKRVAAANLQRAKTLLAYTEVKAPFAGTITQRNVDVGHYVHPAAGDTSVPLLVISQTDKVRVFVDVPEMDAKLVNAGTKPDKAVVRLQSLGEKSLDGTITRTSHVLNPINRSLRTEIDLPNPDGDLRPGMYARVEIVLDERQDVLTLPASALMREGGRTYCCCVENGKINRKEIGVGLRSGQDVEVVAGLNNDDVVVLARAESLKQGQPVEILTTAK